MTRPLTHDSQIARRPDNSLSEMPVPQAIHHDARRQWICRIGEPVRECGPAAGGGRPRCELRRARGEESKKSRLYFVEKSIPNAGLQNVRRGRIRADIAHSD